MILTLIRNCCFYIFFIIFASSVTTVASMVFEVGGRLGFFVVFLVLLVVFWEKRVVSFVGVLVFLF